MCEVNGCFAVAKSMFGKLSVCARCHEELTCIEGKSNGAGIVAALCILGVIMLIGLRAIIFAV